MRGRGGLRFRWASVARSEDVAECMYDGFVFYGVPASLALFHSTASSQLFRLFSPYRPCPEFLSWF